MALDIVESLSYWGGRVGEGGERQLSIKKVFR